MRRSPATTGCMLHGIILFDIAAHLIAFASLLTVALFLPTVAVSIATFELVERPFMKLRMQYLAASRSPECSR